MDVLWFVQPIVETNAVGGHNRGVAVGAGGAEKGEPPTQAIADYALVQPRDRRAAMLAVKSSTPLSALNFCSRSRPSRN